MAILSLRPETGARKTMIATMQTAPAHRLAPFFNPRTVALVGASERSYLARTVWESIRASGYRGDCYPVNPGRSEVFGVTCHPSLRSLPEPADLCLVAVSETGALSVLRDCVAEGVPAAMLFTLFNTTPESLSVRADVSAFLRDAPLAVCGSGTFGAANIDGKFTAFLGAPPAAKPGSVSLVCQSGGILNAVSRCLSSAGAGLCKAVATGGEDQLSAAHYIDYLLSDGRTKAIGCVLEQIKDVGAFRRACEAARAKGVAVVVLVVGRSERGKEAAFAHSGSLASDSRLVDGLLEQVGAIPVANLTELVNVLAVLDRLDGRRIGPKAGIVTISGGETGLAADISERHGVELPALDDGVNAKLQEVLEAPGLDYQNPVDTALGSLLVMTRPETYVESVRAVVDGPEADYVLARHLDADGVYGGLSQLAGSAAKPLFLYTRTTYDLLSLAKDVQGKPLLILPDMEDAIAALGKVSAHHAKREEALRSAPDLDTGDLQPIKFPAGESKLLSEADVFPLLEGIGLQAPPLRLLRSDCTDTDALAGLKPPYVVKIVSPTIVHRRSAGGVAINVQTPAEAIQIAAGFFERFGNRISAVLVASMIRTDVEFILGAKRTDHNGLAIMLGFGGTFVEDLERFALRLSPLSRHDADTMICRSGVEAVLGRLLGDRRAEAVAALSALLLGFDRLCSRIGPALSEFDVNPVALSVDSGTFHALDAKIVLASKGEGE